MKQHDQWVKDVLGIDVSHFESNAPAEAGQTKVAGKDEASADPNASKFTEKLTQVGSVIPKPAADQTEAAGAEEGAAGGEKAEAKGGGGSAIPYDKVIEIGEKIVVALVENSGIKDDGHSLTIIPAGVKPNQVLNGAVGHLDYTWNLVNFYGVETMGLTLSLSYMFCSVAATPGKFLKDIRLIVGGHSSFGVSAKVKTTFGTPGNTGKSPSNWIVDLVVDIDIDWNSGYITSGHTPLRLRLNAANGASAS